MAKREPFDLSSPQAKELRNEIIHGTFVKEGTLVAFPLCFPGCTRPIAADESHITALDVTRDWMVYGGTSGRRVHFFVGMFHGATGVVFDLGVAEGATHCAAICCGQEKFVGFVNGPQGGRAIRGSLHALPFDLLQEWGFTRQPQEDLGEIVAGERLVHAVADPVRARAFGVTEKHLFTIGLDEGHCEVIGEVDAAGRLAIGPGGTVFGLDGADALWRYHPDQGVLTRNAVALPAGRWGAAGPLWAEDPADGRLYTADDDGNLFALTNEHGFTAPLGRTPLAPVRAMAVTRDGRLFGACGDGIGKLFRFDPADGELADLGCAVSVLQRRRYGYEFSDAVTGRDGQIFFAENDRLGHLWIYFPRIRPRGRL